jgi:beta-phosphoglucomutase-like phosphatase (HAD superfamily)
MQVVENIFLEPVGCMAEFPAVPFHEIAARLFGRKAKASKSASRSYWHWLNLMEAAGTPLDATAKSWMEGKEIEAVNGATVYEDVRPAFAELKSMGVRTFVTSSLSRAAVERFVAQSSLAGFLAGMWTREDSGGIKATPLLKALHDAALCPERTVFLADTVEGVRAARAAGIHPVLMMNDPDESRRLAMHNPAGGVVSLHELPDFIRFVAMQKTGLDPKAGTALG